MHANSGTRGLWTLHKHRKDFISFVFSDIQKRQSQLYYADLSAAGRSMMRLRWSKFSVRNTHCVRFNIAFNCPNRLSTMLTCAICSSGLYAKMTTSFRYINANFFFIWWQCYIHVKLKHLEHILYYKLHSHKSEKARVRREICPIPVFVSYFQFSLTTICV